MFWNDLERQIRIRGTAKKLSNDESSSYFDSRPEKSKIAAIISNQSSIIDLNEDFEDKLLKFSNKSISKPKYWGGTLLSLITSNFGKVEKNRLHDRFGYDKEGLNWKINRLSP